MKIYTRTGDDGSTGLSGGSRASKADARIDTMGELDELNAVLGWCRLAIADGEIQKMLETAQNQLFEIGAELSCPPGGRIQYAKVSEASIMDYEQSMDGMSEALPPLQSFILPGGSEAAARLHVARTVCRRAERCIVQFAASESVRPELLSLINRLSDWLFVAARTANLLSNVEDVKWTG